MKGDYDAIKDSSEKIADQDNTSGGQVKTENKLTTVWTLVNFESCQKPSLSTNDFKAVEGIFTRLEHLKKNIVKIEFGNYRSSRENDFFFHDLSVKFLVDTSRLWDSPRAYIWKFLGQDEWKLGDGTMITVNRIHVKH